MQLDLLENTTTSSYPLQGSLTSVETGQTPTKKKCTKCGEVKDISCFTKDPKAKYGTATQCKECYKKYFREHYKSSIKTRMKIYGRRILRKYGLTWETHTALVLRSGGRCDSCGSKFTGGHDTHIDHCHTTGAVRGLLCGGCNKAAGNLSDCPDKIFSLIKYIMETRYNPFLKSEDLHSSKRTT